MSASLLKCRLEQVVPSPAQFSTFPQLPWRGCASPCWVAGLLRGCWQTWGRCSSVAVRLARSRRPFDRYSQAPPIEHYLQGARTADGRFQWRRGTGVESGRLTVESPWCWQADDSLTEARGATQRGLWSGGKGQGDSGIQAWQTAVTDDDTPPTQEPRNSLCLCICVSAWPPVHSPLSPCSQGSCGHQLSLTGLHLLHRTAPLVWVLSPSAWKVSWRCGCHSPPVTTSRLQCHQCCSGFARVLVSRAFEVCHQHRSESWVDYQ